MATSPAADQLVEAHRQAQTQVSVVTAALMIRLWPLLKANDLEGSTDQWLSFSLAALRLQYARSASLTAAYIPRLREIELPGASPFSLAAATDFNEERVVSSLMTMGPQKIRAEIKRQESLAPAPNAEPGRPTRGVELPALRLEKIRNAQAGSAVRLARAGGRDTADVAITQDTKVLGWFRVTQAQPCFWCAMLASRGPVYQEDSFDESDARFSGPGNAKCHDHCGCDLRPLYRRDSVDLDAYRGYEATWIKSQGDRRRGESAVNAFRRHYETRESAA